MARFHFLDETDLRLVYTYGRALIGILFAGGLGAPQLLNMELAKRRFCLLRSPLPGPNPAARRRAGAPGNLPFHHLSGLREWLANRG